MDKNVDMINSLNMRGNIKAIKRRKAKRIQGEKRVKVQQVWVILVAFQCACRIPKSTELFCWWSPIRLATLKPNSLRYARRHSTR